jgi:hypothetical protein
MANTRSKSKDNFGAELRQRADERAGKKTAYVGKSNFVNYSMTTDEKATLKMAVWGIEEYENALIRLAEEEYGIGFSEDAFSGGYSCILRPKFADNKNAGYLLSGRGSTPLKALKQVSYIHWSVFDGDWGAHYQAGKREEIDD